MLLLGSECVGLLMSDEEFERWLVTEMGEGSNGPSPDGYHSFHDYLACPKRYQYAKVRKIKKPLAVMPDHFAVGIMMHAGRAAFLAKMEVIATSLPGADSKVRVVPASQLDDWKQSETEGVKSRGLRFAALDPQVAMDDAANKLVMEITDKARKMAKQYLSEYMDHWSTRPTPRTLATEYEVAHVWENGVRGTARLDDVSFYEEAERALAIGECKTTSTSIESVVTRYTMHPQPMFQQVLWKLSANGEAVHGVIAGTVLDIIKKGYGGKKCEFDRRFIRWEPRTLKQLEAFMVAAKAKAMAMRYADEVPRNFHNCAEMIGNALVPCVFQPLCLQGRDAALQFVDESGKYLHKVDPVGDDRVMPWD